MCSCRVRNIISAAAWESALQKYHISFADYTLPIFLSIAFDTYSWVLAIAEQAWTLASMPTDKVIPVKTELQKRRPDLSCA